MAADDGCVHFQKHKWKANYSRNKKSLARDSYIREVQQPLQHLLPRVPSRFAPRRCLHVAPYYEHHEPETGLCLDMCWIAAWHHMMGFDIQQWVLDPVVHSSHVDRENSRGWGLGESVLLKPMLDTLNYCL